MATILCPNCSATISDEDGIFDCYCCNNVFAISNELIQKYGTEVMKWTQESISVNAVMSEH